MWPNTFDSVCVYIYSYAYKWSLFSYIYIYIYIYIYTDFLVIDRFLGNWNWFYYFYLVYLSGCIGCILIITKENRLDNSCANSLHVNALGNGMNLSFLSPAMSELLDKVDSLCRQIVLDGKTLKSKPLQKNLLPSEITAHAPQWVAIKFFITVPLKKAVKLIGWNLVGIMKICCFLEIYSPFIVLLNTNTSYIIAFFSVQSRRKILN